MSLQQATEHDNGQPSPERVGNSVGHQRTAEEQSVDRPDGNEWSEGDDQDENNKNSEIVHEIPFSLV